MRKRKTWLFIIIMMLFIASAAGVIGFMRGLMYCAWEDSIERRIRPDGTIYELISVGEEQLCLRSITWDGFVMGYYQLPESENDGMHTTYRIIGLIGTELYLYSYESRGDTPSRLNEKIVAYDMQNGVSRFVALAPPPYRVESYDVFFAQNTASDSVFIGHMQTQSRYLTLRKVDAASGKAIAFQGVFVPFRLSSIAVAKNGELFALSIDSRVYMLEGNEWVCLFEPGEGVAVANMTAGEDGEVFLFTASDYGTSAMISTPENRRFAPMDLDTEGLVRLHIAEENRWVGLDSSHRYVIYIAGERYTIETIRTPIVTLWSEDFPPIIVVGATMATVLFAIILLMVINRRLHLLTKLLLIIVPVFTFGILALVSIAERSVKQSVEDGLRDSILEYAYGMSGQLDAERFERINWNAPLEDEYYKELEAYLDSKSGYRVLDIVKDGNVYYHNAYISCWAYRVSGGRVYTAIGGHYVTGLEMKYFAYALDDIRLSDTHNSTKPLNALIGGTGTIISYNTVLYPMLVEDRLVGYLEIARPMTAVDAAVNDLRGGIIKAGMTVFAAVISTLVIVLALSTVTLSKLKRRALDVSGGDYSARVKSRAWDETGEIAAAFNKMAQSVERSVNELTDVSNGYKRFVPDKLVELLDKSSISYLRPGDNKTLTGTQILLYTDSFDSLRDGALFDALSQFHNIVLPCIASADGLMTQHSTRGLAAVFKQPPETVLPAMIALFEALDKGSEAECYVFMSYSGVMLGVTGNEDRLNMIAVSRLIYESSDVGRAGMSLGTRLIVPENMYEKMGDAARRYNHRFIGYMCDENRLMRLYDFFDCDTSEIKVKKNSLKERFEEGVKLYYDKQYSKARRVFVEIIKEFPEDTASREFLRKSHAGLKSGDEPVPLIELR